MPLTYRAPLIRSYRTSAKAHLKVPSELDEIIIGSMLGDLSAEKPSEKANTRLQFKQSIKNREYIEHLFTLFQGYCGSKPLEMSKFDNRPNKMKVYSAIKFQTFSLPCFNKYKDLFYVDGVKAIPHNLEDLLTARGLAYWIMDDGYKSGKGFYICTESYTITDHDLLVKILKNKFNLESSYHKTTNGNRIFIFSSSRDHLLKLVYPYLLPHFYYKFEIEETPVRVSSFHPFFFLHIFLLLNKS